eukprot:Hpha_TRINITY_DN16334_c0_g8::TRINITY_DN16334_c0_g8_i1::g.57983::m.57983
MTFMADTPGLAMKLVEPAIVPHSAPGWGRRRRVGAGAHHGQSLRAEVTQRVRETIGRYARVAEHLKALPPDYSSASDHEPALDSRAHAAPRKAERRVRGDRDGARRGSARTPLRNAPRGCMGEAAARVARGRGRVKRGDTVPSAATPRGGRAGIAIDASAPPTRRSLSLPPSSSSGGSANSDEKAAVLGALRRSLPEETWNKLTADERAAIAAAAVTLQQSDGSRTGSGSGASGTGRQQPGHTPTPASSATPQESPRDTFTGSTPSRQRRAGGVHSPAVQGGEEELGAIRELLETTWDEMRRKGRSRMECVRVVTRAASDVVPRGDNGVRMVGLLLETLKGMFSEPDVDGRGALAVATGKVVELCGDDSDDRTPRPHHDPWIGHALWPGHGWPLGYTHTSDGGEFAQPLRQPPRFFAAPDSGSEPFGSTASRPTEGVTTGVPTSQYPLLPYPIPYAIPPPYRHHHHHHHHLHPAVRPVPPSSERRPESSEGTPLTARALAALQGGNQASAPEGHSRVTEWAQKAAASLKPDESAPEEAQEEHGLCVGADPPTRPDSAEMSQE